MESRQSPDRGKKVGGLANIFSFRQWLQKISSVRLKEKNYVLYIREIVQLNEGLSPIKANPIPS